MTSFPVQPIFPPSGNIALNTPTFLNSTTVVATSTSTNPLQDYSTPNVSPSMTTGGVLVNQVYAVEGIVSSVKNNTTLRYNHPATNQANNTSAGQVSLQNTAVPQTSWLSPIVDDNYNTGFNLTLQFNKKTYLNYIVFDLLQVPCSWTLYQGSVNSLNQIYSGIINVYNPSVYETIELNLSQTYTFDLNTPLILVLNKVSTGTQYSLSVQNFIAKYIITQYSDLTVLGNVTASGITAQNNLGFIETYNPQTFPLSNMFLPNQNQTYWKSSPQPVKDAVVWFVVDLGYQQTVNRMYLDPLYLGSPLNIYYSDVYTNVNDPTTLTWYPISRDFTMKKGIFTLPPTFTRYLKFEITQLTPEPYVLPLESVNRTIQVFPDWIDSYYDQIELGISNIDAATYNVSANSQTPSQAVSTSINYNTAPQVQSNYGQATSQLSSSTFGSTGSNSVGNYSVVDPTVSYKTLLGIGDLGSIYNNVTNGSFINKRFLTYGTHQYKNVNITQTWHQAYFTGIKYLSFYAYTPNKQTDTEEFIDYFLPTIISSGNYSTSPTTIISGNSTATFGIPVGDATAISGSMTVAGGWLGKAGQFIQTKNLQTFQNFNSFKFGALDSGWESFFGSTNSYPNVALLQGGTAVASGNVTIIPSIGVVISGVNFTNSNVSIASPQYNIFTLSGSSGISWIKSPSTGSLNLFTTPQANVVSGTGWSGGPVVSGNTVITTSGAVTSTIQNWNSAYGENEYAGGLTYGGSVSSLGYNPYTFLVTAYGTGSVTVSGIYYDNTNTLISGYSQTFPIASSGTNISFTSNATGLGAEVVFDLLPSANTTFYQAGLFQGSTAYYTNPIILNNMNVSAVARMYLPNTNYGTYTCGLYTVSGTTGTLIASQAFKNLPTQTWLDIVVPYNLQNTPYSNFYVQLSQSFGNGPTTVGETYQVAMLGVFFSPINYQFSTDNGSTWKNITTGINNPNVNINTLGPTQQLSIKANYLQDNTFVQALEIVPNVTQTPFYTTANIQTLSDPKVNEIQSLQPPMLRPLFQLNSEAIPSYYSIQQLMNISNPYQLP